MAAATTHTRDSATRLTTMTERIARAVEAELDAVDRVLAALSLDDPAEGERSARALASLARTLRDLAQMSASADTSEAARDDDDPVPRDLDEFRRELARRIDAFIDAEADGGVPGDADGGLERQPRR